MQTDLSAFPTLKAMVAAAEEQFKTISAHKAKAKRLLCEIKKSLDFALAGWNYTLEATIGYDPNRPVDYFSILIWVFANPFPATLKVAIRKLEMNLCFPFRLVPESHSRQNCIGLWDTDDMTHLVSPDKQMILRFGFVEW